MVHAKKPDIVFRRKGRVHLNRRGRQISRLLAAEVCASAVVMLDTPCSEVVWRELATHSILQFPLHFPSHASTCVITLQLESTRCSKIFAVTNYLRSHTWHMRRKASSRSRKVSVTGVRFWPKLEQVNKF